MGDLGLALITCDSPVISCVLATENRMRAPSASRAKSLAERGHPVRGVLVTIGNANAFNEHAAQDEAALAAALATMLGCDPNTILTAATGELGRPLPLKKLIAALPDLVAHRINDPSELALAILTTDERPKLLSTSFTLADRTSSITVIAKGAKRSAPELATFLVFVLTDMPLTREALRLSVEAAAATTLQQLELEGEPSTNDQVIALAPETEDAFHAGDPETSAFIARLTALFERLTLLCAKDAAGRNRAVSIKVSGAQSFGEARALALGLASSPILRESLRHREAGGAVASALGATAAIIDCALELDHVQVIVNDALVFERGRMIPLPLRMMSDFVEVDVIVGTAKGYGTATCAEAPPRRRRKSA